MDRTYILTSDGELYHYGILGMKWGRRRYQNPDGSLTAAGKKRYDDEMSKVEAETKRLKAEQRNKTRTANKLNKLEAAKKELADLKKARKEKSPEELAKKAEKEAKKAEKKAEKAAEKEAKKTEKATKKAEEAIEDDNAKRERLLKAPNAKEVLANRHLFNDREIQSIRLRLNEERMIADLAPPEIDKGQRFVDKFAKTSNQISTVVESGSKAWNGVAKLYNSFFAEKTGVELPMISDKVKSATDKIKSKAEKIKADAELLKAQNELAEARKKDPNREKTADELFDEETRQLNRKVARQKAENSLAEEAARTVKAENTMAEQTSTRDKRLAAEAAKAKAEAMAAQRSERVKLVDSIASINADAHGTRQKPKRTTIDQDEYDFDYTPRNRNNTITENFLTTPSRQTQRQAQRQTSAGKSFVDQLDLGDFSYANLSSSVTRGALRSQVANQRAEAYARDYLKNHPNSSLSINDLVERYEGD